MDVPMAPAPPQPAAPPQAPEPYQIPLPGPSQASQTPQPKLSGYLAPAEPAAPPLDPVAAAEAALRAEEERQSDILAFATPPETIAGYLLEPPPPGVERSIEQEISMRTLFRESGIPAPVGAEINRLWNKALVNPPSEIERSLQGQSCKLALEREWGPEFNKRLDMARAEVQRMAKVNPNIIGMLEQSGLGDNVYIIRSLYNMARVKGDVK